MQIASQLNISFGRVYQLLRTQGIPCRPKVRPPREKEPRGPRVVDRLLNFLQGNPRSTVEQIAAGLSYEKHGTIGQLLSRLKKENRVISEVSDTPCKPFLWSVVQA